MGMIRSAFYTAAHSIDWALVAPALVITSLGLLTMHTFGISPSLAPRQLMWAGIAFLIYLMIAPMDIRFIRRTKVIRSEEHTSELQSH